MSNPAIGNSLPQVMPPRRRAGGGLKAKQIEAAKPNAKPYKLTDARGLFLLVMPNGAKHWRWKFRLQGKERQAAFGSFPDVSLAEAREKMEEARRLVKAGQDPVAQKHAQTKPAARAVTFRQLAERYVDGREDDWKNPKHRQQWRNTLATYVYPEIGEMPVAEIDTSHIEKLLTPIWRDKPETASRVRGRIEAVLSYAKTLKLRSGENPAAWRDNLAHTTLGKRKRQVSHHAAMDWREIGAFMAKLRDQPGIGARALEFTILTAARSGEVRGAKWAEVDLGAALWIVPAERMKAHTEHRVPLSERALAVLEAMRPFQRDGGLVFPGVKSGTSLSDMTLSAVLRRMGLGHLTVHGFRSTFRDWCAEATAYPRDVAEQALAHTLRDKVEAAYRRGDMLDKRRRLMNDWAEHCGREVVVVGEVVPLRA